MTEKKPLWQWRASDLAASIRRGDIRCEDTVMSCIERMKAVNPDVNAVVVDMSDQALQQAREADLAVKNGDRLGLLHGVPITVKVNVDVAGQPNSAGIKEFAGNIVPGDAAVVQNIKNAGAIVIGLTNMPDVGTRYQTDNPLYGLTKNPWDARISCGGSSGGAAAALAAGICPIAHGNDIGGSVRMPAYSCGVSSIRPTLGRVPAYNSSQREEKGFVAQLFMVEGPMARNVQDVRLLLEVMAQGNVNDPWWVPAALSGPAPEKPIRVAITRVPAGNKPHRVIAEGIDKAAQYLATAGYAVEAVEAPFSLEIFDIFNSLMGAELRDLSGEFIQEYASDAVKSFLNGIWRLTKFPDLEGYMRALKERTAHLRQWQRFLDQYPIVVSPYSLALPYPVDEDLKGDQRVANIMTDLLTSVSINCLGLPAAIAPIGIHEGVPYGIQLVGQRFREDMVLDAAEAIQSQVGILPEKLWLKKEPNTA